MLKLRTALLYLLTGLLLYLVSYYCFLLELSVITVAIFYISVTSLGYMLLLTGSTLLSRSHRCNPLDPHNMLDITDAAESARTIMLGLNRE
jgi:hypothetical protein